MRTRLDQPHPGEPPAPPHSLPPEDIDSGMNFARAILSRKLFILLVAILGAGLGYLYYLKTPPVYRSSAKVVLNWQQPPIFDENVQQMVSPLWSKIPTDIQTIMSRTIVTPAIGIPGTAPAGDVVLANGETAPPEDAELLRRREEARRWEALALKELGLQASLLEELTARTPGAADAAPESLPAPEAADSRQLLEALMKTAERRSPDRRPMAAEPKPRLDLRSLRSVGASNPEGAVLGGLAASQDEFATDIIRLSYSGPVAEDCPKILQAVIDAYIDYIRQSQKSSSNELLTLIRQARDELDAELQLAEALYARFKQTTTLLVSGTEAVNYYALRVQEIETQRQEAIRDREVKSARLKAIRSVLADGGSKEAINFIITQESADRGNLDTPANVLTEIMRLEIERQLQLSKGLGEEHSKVKSLTTQIELMRSMLQAEDDKLTAQGAGRRDVLTVYLEALEHQLKIADTEIARLDDLFQVQQAKARELAQEENTDRILREMIQRKKALYTAVIQRMETMSLTKDGERITVTQLDRLDRPGSRLQPTLPKSLGIGAAGGMCLAVLLALLFEMRDLSFRDPGEVGRELGGTVIGHVPLLPVRSARRSKLGRIDKTVVAYHQPKSRQAESFRSVRTALMIASREKHPVFQLTSPDPGDGKTTVTCNLAVVLAKAGKRCLLVDCDLRRPRIHKVLGLDNTGGASSIIVGQTDFLDVAQRDVVPGLDVITAGPRVDDPAEILHSPRFVEFLESVREKYDIILLDSPPLLAVSESSTIAGIADGVILVVRIGRHNRPLARRARETLDIVGARILGVIVNAVEPNSRYGKYGGYAYRYGAYSYGYGYADSPYFESRAADPVPPRPARPEARAAGQN